MANRLQHLRGSEAEHSTFTGAKGEISLVTDTSSDRIPTGEVRVHDGTTAGGLPLTLGTTSKPLTNNIVLGSGVGINFNNYGSEDSNNATTVGSNLLDDYEEGSWTPNVYNGSSGNSNWTTQQGYYFKIGAIVICQFWCDGGTSPRSGNTTQNLYLEGLPFAYTGYSNMPTLVAFTANNITATDVLMNRQQTSTTSFQLLTPNGGGITNGIDYCAGTIIYSA